MESPWNFRFPRLPFLQDLELSRLRKQRVEIRRAGHYDRNSIWSDWFPSVRLINWAEEKDVQRKEKLIRVDAESDVQKLLLRHSFIAHRQLLGLWIYKTFGLLRNHRVLSTCQRLDAGKLSLEYMESCHLLYEAHSINSAAYHLHVLV